MSLDSMQASAIPSAYTLDFTGEGKLFVSSHILYFYGYEIEDCTIAEDGTLTFTLPYYIPSDGPYVPLALRKD